MMREEGRQEETIIHRRNGYVESKITEVAAGPPCRAAVGVFSLRHCMVGYPPPFWLWGGHLTLSLLWSIAGVYCGVAARKGR